MTRRVLFLGFFSPLFLLLLLLLFRLSQVSAFSNIKVEESIGGLITDPCVLEDRKRIDAATVDQMSPIITVTAVTTKYELSLACYKDNLTFYQVSIAPHPLVCNITGYTDIPLSVSFDTDIYALATLLPPFWLYFSPGPVDRTLNISICRHRMGSVYLRVWVREAKPWNRDGVLFPFDLSNDTLVKYYVKWLLKGSQAFEESSGAEMGLHLKILRSRGIAEIIFRVIVAVMVCILTLVMGCELDVMLIWKHFKKPVSPIIGFACQYGLMPLVSLHLTVLNTLKSVVSFFLCIYLL